MQGVTVIPQSHPAKKKYDFFQQKKSFIFIQQHLIPAIGGDVIDVNVLVDVDNKLSLGVNLHQHLFLVHRLHHLSRKYSDRMHKFQ